MGSGEEDGSLPCGKQQTSTVDEEGRFTRKALGEKSGLGGGLQKQEC